MMNREELLKLADRCEQADGPSYALERDIAKALNPNFTRMTVPKNYTASIDAAMQLVPEGWTGLIPVSGGEEAWLWPNSKPSRGHRCNAATPALALCAAALRAIAEKEG